MLKEYFYNLLGKKRPEVKKLSTQELMAELKNRESDTEEHRILNNFSPFLSKTISEITIPRSNISDIRSDASLDEVSALINRTNHTRTLVYEKEHDNIIGFIHIKDLYRIVTGSRQLVMKELLRAPLSLPSSMKLLDALVAMQQGRIHIALVIDEYGSIDGIITIEDIIEALFGPIQDEHDQEEVGYSKIDDHNILTHGRVKVEDIEQLIGKKLKDADEECETISGLVLIRSGYMVTAGTKIKIAPEVEAQIIDASPRTIKQIKLVISK